MQIDVFDITEKIIEAVDNIFKSLFKMVTHVYTAYSQ